MNKRYVSTKVIELGSCAFRQWKATHSHCQYIHGYQLKAKFTVAGSELDDKNWIFDFAGFKEIKFQLQNQFDHKLCIAKDDPLIDIFYRLAAQGGCQLRVMEGVGIEKTAEYCFNVADEYIRKITNNRCWVENVEVFEHEDNSASYSVTGKNTVTVATAENIQTAEITNLVTQQLQPLEQLPVQSLTPSPGRHSTAAPVGQGPTSGLGGLFAGTRLG